MACQFADLLWTALTDTTDGEAYLAHAAKLESHRQFKGHWVLGLQIGAKSWRHQISFI